MDNHSKKRLIGAVPPAAVIDGVSTLRRNFAVDLLQIQQRPTADATTYCG